MLKIIKIVVKLWVGDDDIKQKTQVITLKMTKIVLKTRITERRRTVIMTQSSTVDLRNRFIAVMTQKNLVK